MKYYSEKTKKMYDAEKDLISAEKEFDKREAELIKIREAKSARAKEIEDAYKAIQLATKKYNNLINDFIKDYGEYHTTYRNSVINIDDLFSEILDFKLFK